MKKVITVALVLFQVWIIILLINSNKETAINEDTNELYSILAYEIPKSTILFMQLGLGFLMLITGIFVWYHYKGYKKRKANPEASMVLILAHLVFIIFTIFGGITKYSEQQEYWNIIMFYLLLISVKVLTILYVIPKRTDYKELIREVES